MITSQNVSNEPFILVTTKREIFSNQNESQFHSLIKQESLPKNEDNLSDFNLPLHYLDIQQSQHSQLPIPTVKIITPLENEELMKQKSLVLQSSFNIQEGLNDTWKKGGLKIIKYVAKFLYQLKTNANTLKIKLMNKNIFKLLGDRSSNFDNFKLGDQLQQKQRLFWKLPKKLISTSYMCLKMSAKQINRIGIIYPESTFKIIWDSIVVCIIVMNIFYIPMSLSFSFDKSSQISQLFFETIPSYIFIVEILLNFNTAYYSQGIIHHERTHIFLHYIKNNFFLDLIVAIPFILAQFDIPYIQFILLLRITRVRAMIQNVEDLLNLKEEIQAILDLGKLIYFLVLVAHMCSCAWHLLGIVEYENYGDENSWLLHYGYYNQDWFDRYTVSFYWSVITTLTVGYGDIVPQTTVERFFVIIVALVICGVFAYTISSIGEILKNLQERKAGLKRNMKKVNQYIKQKQLNFQLSLKVRKYFEFKFQIDEQLQEQDDTVLNKLNEQLKQEVLVDIYKKVLLNSQFLKKNIPDNLINKLCLKVKQAQFAPGYDVVNVYDPASKLLFLTDGIVDTYFINKGLSVLNNNNENQNQKENIGKIYKQLQPGEVIGEFEFIINRSYQFYFKTSTFCSLVYIERSDFLQVINEDEECRQKFNEIKEKLTYQKTYGRTCEVCRWTHRYKECPFVFLQTNIWRIARNSNKDIFQQRFEYSRTKYVKKKREPGEHNQILAKCLEFVLNNGLLQEDQINDNYLALLGYGIKEQLFEKLATIDGSSSSDETSKLDQASQLIRQKQGTIDASRSSILKQLKVTNPIQGGGAVKFQMIDEESSQNQSPTVNENQKPININYNGTNPSSSSLRLSHQSILKTAQQTQNQQLFQKLETQFHRSTQQLSQTQLQQFSTGNYGTHFLTFQQQHQDSSDLEQRNPNNLAISKAFVTLDIDIDKMKNYEYYFPDFNFTSIQEKLERQRHQTLSKGKKRTLKAKLKSIMLNKSSFKGSINSSSKIEYQSDLQSEFQQ